MLSRLESGWSQPVQPDSMLSRLETGWNQLEILPNLVPGQAGQCGQAGEHGG
jgi:hypothetical protein